MNSILHWCGRFGNNVQQLLNSLYFFEKNSLNYQSIDHEFIYPITKKFGRDSDISCRFFFHVDSEVGNGYADFQYNIDELKMHRRRLGKIVYENLKFETDQIQPFDDRTIVVHVRSGDIFSRENYYCPVVSCYIQNPLKYYLDVISQYDKAIIVTEDHNNPIISELSRHPKVERVVITSMLDTIKILLSAKNLASPGVSSFSPAIAAISRNIIRFHASTIKMNEVLNYTDLQNQDIDIRIYPIDIPRYINYGTWINVDEQRHLMLSYE